MLIGIICHFSRKLLFVAIIFGYYLIPLALSSRNTFLNESSEVEECFGSDDKDIGDSFLFFFFLFFLGYILCYSIDWALITTIWVVTDILAVIAVIHDASNICSWLIMYYLKSRCFSIFNIMHGSVKFCSKPFKKIRTIRLYWQVQVERVQYNKFTRQLITKDGSLSGISQEWRSKKTYKW